MGKDVKMKREVSAHSLAVSVVFVVFNCWWLLLTPYVLSWKRETRVFSMTTQNPTHTTSFRGMSNCVTSSLHCR